MTTTQYSDARTRAGRLYITIVSGILGALITTVAKEHGVVVLGLVISLVVGVINGFISSSLFPRRFER